MKLITVSNLSPCLSIHDMITQGGNDMTKILLGTYTKKESKGIYSIELDETTQTLRDLKLVTATQNPTYLDFDPKTSTLYSVYQEGKNAGIAAWNFNGDTAELLYTQTQEGVPPCYVRYHEAEASIYDANYHGGFVRVTQDQELHKIIQYQEGSHAHYVDYDPNDDCVYVCDLGLNTIRKYELMNEIATFKTEEGMGPRHIAFHPTKKVLYAFGEHNNQIITLVDEGFELKQIQSISTLPDPAIESAGAAIRISKDGRFVYASNRGHDSIAILKVLEDDTLEKIDTISTYGEHPRDFAISPDQKYLVVANRDTDNLTLYLRDEDTGRLTLLQKDVYAPEAVAVYFI